MLASCKTSIRPDYVKYAFCGLDMLGPYIFSSLSLDNVYVYVHIQYSDGQTGLAPLSRQPQPVSLGKLP